MAFPDNRKQTQGFTLIEVVIAIALFAVVSVLAYSGLQSVINSKTRTENELERLRQLQISMLNLTSDLEQLSNRDGNDALGGQLHKLTTQNLDYSIEFTRSGVSNFAGLPRSSLQRVAYHLEEDELVRTHWPYVDRADDEQKIERQLIANVSKLSFRFLSSDTSEAWSDNWPPDNVLTGSNPATLPRAIEITLELGDWGSITRLVQVVAK